MSDVQSRVIGGSGTQDRGGVGACLAGVAALLVGLFVLGGPAGLAAIAFGRRGVAQGSPAFGRTVQVLGWLELVVTVVATIALASGGAN